jgi:hypothetical protein
MDVVGAIVAAGAVSAWMVWVTKRVMSDHRCDRR